MAERWIEYEESGAPEALLGLETSRVRANRWLRNMLDGMGNYTLYWMRIYMHVNSGYTLRHSDRTRVTFLPGGPGGGGWYQVTVGIKRGDSKHPVYADQGTGIYVGRGVIRPTIPFQIQTAAGRRGGVLTFQKRGEPRRFKRWVRGQRPQHYMYGAYQQAHVYAHARVLTFGRELFTH